MCFGFNHLKWCDIFHFMWSVDDQSDILSSKSLLVYFPSLFAVFFLSFSLFFSPFNLLTLNHNVYLDRYASVDYIILAGDVIHCSRFYLSTVYLFLLLLSEADRLDDVFCFVIGIRVYLSVATGNGIDFDGPLACTRISARILFICFFHFHWQIFMYAYAWYLASSCSYFYDILQTMVAVLHSNERPNLFIRLLFCA